jgi:hypothetical protein
VHECLLATCVSVQHVSERVRLRVHLGIDKEVKAALQAQSAAAWGAAAGKARSNKAEVAAKKDGSKVCGCKVAWSFLRWWFSAWCEGACAYSCK